MSTTDDTDNADRSTVTSSLICVYLMSSSPSRRPLVERGNEKETTVPKKKENSNASAFRVERLATPEPEEVRSALYEY